MTVASEFPSLFIEEPSLTFGEGKRYIDPKMGLLAYGPCLLPHRRAISSSIRLGIIGSKETIDLAQLWIDRCQHSIPGKSHLERLFPAFPGFSRVFGCELRVVGDCIEKLAGEDVSRVIHLRDPYERVRQAAALVVSKLSNLQVRDPRPHVVVCALPQEVIDHCGVARSPDAGPAKMLTGREKRILEDIKEHRRVGQTTLVPLDDETLDMISEAANLRRLIKAKAMAMGIPTQLAKPTTFLTNPKGESVQDMATRAWNFSVALYYKAEGYPWKLVDMSPGTCYVGVSFYYAANHMGTSMAQIFTHTGEGLVLKGGRAVVDPTTRSPHLPVDAASQLLSDAIQMYRSQMGQSPARLVVHKSSRYWPDELSGFRKAAEDVKQTDFVTILSRGLRLMRRKGRYPPVRGTAIQIGHRDYLLFTKGWTPYHETYAGLGVPTPLEIAEHYGDTTLETVCREILALTKMNWNSADFAIREPITLAYSREVGKILSYVPEGMSPRPEYRFYM